ncbi:glutathione S-transferase [Trichonephila inaurata madagascariensis]|uniref:glutathione transferase n=1 Tax=Trichonephila inaurata madagascariensis TaxID=2747483 RepID=A0A8X7CBV6_9ARAC|nr:glutathione S-transferase [Trichonephila inaurata madagascariensis]
MIKPILGYWNIRGLAEPIRSLLHYKKVDFEDKRYVSGTDEWSNDKFNLEFDFPNLPYYMEGDVKITQSTTIIRYLGHKHGLDGKDDKQRLRVSLAEQQIVDLRTRLVNLCYSKNYESMKGNFIKKIPDQMKLWEKFVGNRKFLAGNNIAYVDFIAYETFYWFRLFHKDTFYGCPNLQIYQDRMKNLPELQDYLNSPRYKKWPIFTAVAKFGSSGESPEHA